MAVEDSPYVVWSTVIKNVCTPLVLLGAIVTFWFWGWPKQSAELNIAEADAANKAKPILHVSPIVKQLPAVRDVRKIQIEMQLANAGESDVLVSEIKTEVYVRATAS